MAKQTLDNWQIIGETSTPFWNDLTVAQFGPIRVISDMTIISLHMGKVHNWLYEYFPRVHRILL